MNKLLSTLTIWMSLFAAATAGTVYIEGPNDRGEGPLLPAMGWDSIDELGLFFVDIYAEDMPGFAGFQATLQLLDDTLANAADPTIFVAYNHMILQGAAYWGDWQITWNEDFLPQIMEVATGSTFGLMSFEREWIPHPVNDWGDWVDKTITEKTWLMTVGYWYFPGAEGDGSQTYTIGVEPATTVFGDGDAERIPITVVAGSVTIGVPGIYVLTVESSPITGVNITGDKPGTTGYRVLCNDQEVVSLTAPPTVEVGPVRFDFVRWEGYPEGQATIEITMDAPRTVSVVYDTQTPTLTVGSTPITGISITGDRPGITNYAVICDRHEAVTLVAPEIATTSRGLRYCFVRWEGYPEGQATVELTMDADRTVDAVYEFRPHTLTVESTPITGVAIAGSRSGVTDYTAACRDLEIVSLAAPEIVTTPEGIRYDFVHWDWRIPGQATIELTMFDDAKATAVYVATGTVYIEGPDDRGEGPLPRATGETSLDELGLFFVDIYVENVVRFAGFEAALDFLDDMLTNAAGSTIFVAYNHFIPDLGAPWNGRQITWNQELLPEIVEVATGFTVGLLSNEREWLPSPINDWGDDVYKTIADKTWLMTVGYWYLPGAEGTGIQTHTIDTDPKLTSSVGVIPQVIPHIVVAGSVTIGAAGARNLIVRSTPMPGVTVTGDSPGTTNYVVEFDDETTVNLCVPESIADGAARYPFRRWMVDGVEVAPGRNCIEVTMDTGHVAVAEYVREWHVDDDAPADFNTIQAAIDAASDGDIIIVRDGTYTGGGNRDIDFKGKAVLLTSENGPANCIIDCEHGDRAFSFTRGEAEDSIVNGFTITRGRTSSGAGIYCSGSSPTIANNIITGNMAMKSGGGVYVGMASPTIVGNTISDNRADAGGAIRVAKSALTIANNILWRNAASDGSQIWLSGYSTFTVSHSNIQGEESAVFLQSGCILTWGTGNVEADPLFADPGHWDDSGTPDDTSDDTWINGDYHLKSQYGRWDPNANAGDGGWVFDDVSSPCIDTGDPASDHSNEPTPNGERINMGAYGNTDRASRSGPWWVLPGDCNGDSLVDVLDLIFVRNVHRQDPTTGDNWRADVNEDGAIDVLDMLYVRNRLGTKR